MDSPNSILSRLMRRINNPAVPSPAPAAASSTTNDTNPTTTIPNATDTTAAGNGANLPPTPDARESGVIAQPTPQPFSAVTAAEVQPTPLTLLRRAFMGEEETPRTMLRNFADASAAAFTRTSDSPAGVATPAASQETPSAIPASSGKKRKLEDLIPPKTTSIDLEETPRALLRSFVSASHRENVLVEPTAVSPLEKSSASKLHASRTEGDVDVDRFIAEDADAQKLAEIEDEMAAVEGSASKRARLSLGVPMEDQGWPTDISKPPRAPRAPTTELPRSLVDRLFKAWVQMPVSKQALDEVYSQSHAFLQRTCEDLQAFAKHAGRKTVESSDVALHMKVSEEKLVTMVRETLPMEYQEALLPVVRAAAPSEDAS